ncbi:MAG: hypothetical protein ACOYXS_09150 [Chloroflexota bacterium]
MTSGPNRRSSRDPLPRDFGAFLVGAEHEFAVTEEQLEARTDVHAMFSAGEVARAKALAEANRTRLEGPVLPIQVLGSGPFINAAVDNGVGRAARLLGMTVDEVKNRATISGAIEIGRLPGFVQVNLLVPRERLERLGIAHLVEAQYGPAAGW